MCIQPIVSTIRNIALPRGRFTCARLYAAQVLLHSKYTIVAMALASIEHVTHRLGAKTRINLCIVIDPCGKSLGVV
jgi:hypothetical protein